MPAYRIYDHRLKRLIADSRNPLLFPDLNIPRSTAKTWIKNGVRPVITHPDLDADAENLLLEHQQLKVELARFKTKNDLIDTTFKIFGLQVQFHRLPHPEAKSSVLDLIWKASSLLPIKECLDAIGLTSARYYQWVKRQVRCLLADRSSCPRLSPNRLIPSEFSTIKELVTSKEFYHFSIPSLVWFAKRQGKVFASLSAWYRLIIEHNLKRPRERIYPPKPKIGIRASAPNQIWHLDQTLLRLENGTRIFIQAVIDNFSRLVLAWDVTLDYGGIRTRALLEKAIKVASEIYPAMRPLVMVDSGTENLNSHVDRLVQSRAIDRLVAQIDIEFSNSMIEAFFRTLKHRWLYLIGLPNFEAVKAALETYMKDYCLRIPLDALNGGTPAEVFSGKWTPQSTLELQSAALDSRRIRLTTNKSLSCGACP